MHGQIEVIELMCNNGVTKRHPGLTTLLHDLVVSTAPLHVVLPVLVRYEFDINSMRRGDGYTPLHLVCLGKDIDLFKLVVVLGGDINAIANDNLMPLNCSLKNCPEISSYLIKLGATDKIVMCGTRG